MDADCSILCEPIICNHNIHMKTPKNLYIAFPLVFFSYSSCLKLWTFVFQTIIITNKSRCWRHQDYTSARFLWTIKRFLNKLPKTPQFHFYFHTSNCPVIGLSSSICQAASFNLKWSRSKQMQCVLKQRLGIKINDFLMD